MNLGSTPVAYVRSDEHPSAPAVLTADYWDEVFAEPDPWRYGESGYEAWKFALTLSALPEKSIGKAMELGCAEGHLTALLAPKVDQLLSVDISAKAVARAQERCAALKNVVFEERNITEGPLPKNLDLILCSEVLYYLPLPLLQEFAPRIAKSLAVGGHLLLTHGNVIADDPTRTGFDWDQEYGALTIGQVFQGVDGLSLVKEVRTPLFTIQLFRRDSARKKAGAAQIVEEPLPFDLELSAELEGTIVWDGAVVTRAEACASERARQIPILMYHSVADSGPAELSPYRTGCQAFRDQMRYLKRNGYYTVSLDDWADAVEARTPLPGRPVIITFDDAYRDFLVNACPALERSNFKATVFVPTDKVGIPADWDPVSEPLQIMTWDELREIVDRGMSVGSHSASHRNLAELTAAEVRSEAEQSRAALESKLGVEVASIAFPWGNSTPEARAVLAACGYRIGVRSWGGPSPLNDDLLNLSRIEIGDDDLDSFVAKLNGDHEPMINEDDTEDPWLEPEEEDPWIEPESEDIESEDDLVEFGAPPSTPVRAATESQRAPTPRPAVPPRQTAPAVGDSYSHRLALAARLDALIGEFVTLQSELLNSVEAPMTIQKRLLGLFTLPITGEVRRTLRPFETVAPDIAVGFDDTSQVQIRIEPKADHTLSPDQFLNTFTLDFAGEGDWLAIEVDVDWRDISLANQFQFCLYAQPNRSVECAGVLRLPRRQGKPFEIAFTNFELSAGDRNYVSSGQLQLPDFIELDTTAQPQLLLTMDTSANLSIVMHYLNVYFA